MPQFEKEIVRDPLDDFDSVKAPNSKREGPIAEVINQGVDGRTSESELVREAAKHEKESGYHYSEAKRGHWSTASGCSTQSYLNYVHKLDPEAEYIPTDVDSKRTFTHGDLIHLWIQGIFLDQLGQQYVNIEETIDDDLSEEYGIAGHADIVIRGHDDFPDPFVVDIKSAGEFTYYSFADDGHARSIPKRGHIMQLMGYMNHIGAEYGAILYYSKRNDHIEEYWTSFDSELFNEGRRNIINVLEHVNSGTVPEKDADSYLCNPQYCKFRREGICPGVENADKYDEEGDRLDEFNYQDPEWD